MRLDVLLVKRGLFESRAKAQGAIAAGRVSVEKNIITKVAFEAEESSAVEVAAGDDYVGRGALKLKAAIAAFNISLKERVAVDIGASTGGFTQVLLRAGAARVYAVDVGENQLAPIFRDDVRVVSLENTNARTLDKRLFEKAPSLAVADVSFISLELVMPAVFACLEGEAEAVLLVKPQFEAGRAQLTKRGIVRDARVHAKVIAKLCACAHALGFHVRGVMPSPVLGGEGNREFLLYVRRSPAEALLGDELEKAIQRAAHG